MKKIKVFALLATLFVGIFSNLFTPVVSAVEPSGDATVTIHKLKNKTGPIVNTGNELSGYTASDFLDGITYNVYDVTAAYHTEYSKQFELTTWLRMWFTSSMVAHTEYSKQFELTTAQEADDKARDYVQGTAGHAPTVSGATLVRTETTAGGGAATFNLPKKSGGKDAVYVFVEQPKTGIRAAAENLVLRFPVYQLNGDGTYTDIELSAIHLYPKNTTETITPVKEITTPNHSYNVGEKIGFKLSTKIPANIGIKEVDGVTPHYNTFGLIDTYHDTTLTFNPAGYELKVAGTSIVLTDKEETPDYTIEVGEGQDTFKVELTQAGINKLAEQGGKTLEFTYTMKLNKFALIDGPNVNQVTVEYGRKITDSNGVVTFYDVVTQDGNTTEVYTGGYRFIKTDFSTNKPLAGAEFVVRNADAPDAKYLKIEKIDAVTKEISWVDTYEEAFKFKTEDDGIVDITGLKYGTYYLEETIAPDDYVKLSERIAFTVEFNSYLSRITNEVTPLSLPDESDSDTPTEFKEHNVPNTPIGFLPQTGGAGIILFVALGAAMVGLAGVYFTSRRKDA
ncbi:SpaH/EbpB family LPXTG-anchored major pilin [Streptococcus parasuis]|uniref:Isopeptide-forming domain-containing fimbrial protein n=1 Tax=Streptococcus parasuis TaxID=1501662 RepID=A0A4Q8L2R9_9STRE|nr:SpaH/EbpB family LPXTG-anchored major pilin [Streptococcus parasuis]TAA14510.1 isopeptide-forming domain-containing fimbrial protein [Streptococcus parasuis]